MSDPILLRDDQDAIATLTLNSPGSLNALSEAMIAALSDELDRLAQDRSVRAVILKGAGKAFCAGHDLREMTAGRQAEDGGQAYFKDLFATCSAMMLKIPRLPQPVIAEVHGIATAAGCQLVATCDMAVAANGTRFGVNGVNVGLFCSTPMVALSRNIHRKAAMEMLTTGRFISVEKAETLGLINRAVPGDELAAASLDLAEAVAAKLGTAVKIGKEAFYQQITMPLEDAYSYAGDVMAQNMLFKETEEGIKAFLEKRDPTWTQ